MIRTINMMLAAMFVFTAVPHCTLSGTLQADDWDDYREDREDYYEDLREQREEYYEDLRDRREDYYEDFYDDDHPRVYSYRRGYWTGYRGSPAVVFDSDFDDGRGVVHYRRAPLQQVSYPGCAPVVRRACCR